MQLICYYFWFSDFYFLPSFVFLLFATHELKVSYFFSGCQIFKLCFISLKTMLCFFFYIQHPCNKNCGARARCAFISSYISSTVVKSSFFCLSNLLALLNHLLVQRESEKWGLLLSSPGLEGTGEGISGLSFWCCHRAAFMAMPLSQVHSLKQGWKHCPSHIICSCCLIWWGVSMSASNTA